MFNIKEVKKKTDIRPDFTNDDQNFISSIPGYTNYLYQVSYKSVHVFGCNFVNTHTERRADRHTYTHTQTRAKTIPFVSRGINIMTLEYLESAVEVLAFRSLEISQICDFRTLLLVSR